MSANLKLSAVRFLVRIFVLILYDRQPVRSDSCNTHDLVAKLCHHRAGNHCGIISQRLA